MQFDWLELPDPPTSWGWGTMAHLFVQRRQDAQIQDATKPLLPSITHST
jgi:hypothetical protein